jgi:hypothetical protein
MPIVSTLFRLCRAHCSPGSISVGDKQGKTSYPSPPASDAGDVSDLPTMIHMDPEELVRATPSQRRSRPPPSLFSEPIQWSIARSRLAQSSWLSLLASPEQKTYLSPFTRFQQLEIANTIQTNPQETGFWSIIGPFLIDMTFEIAYLIWFFLSEVLYPRLWTIVVILASPVLVGVLAPILIFNSISNPNIRTSLKRSSSRRSRTRRPQF